ncbi:MAG: PAS domain S-box protein [Gammaproteobacteria bacterium]|nr:MAG: PAS domain S-box protein [Gammaproteobacteria bacterium]
MNYISEYFAELNPNPIIEFNSNRILYLNLTARALFPGLHNMGLHHPILDGLIGKITHPLQNQNEFIVFARELTFSKHIYEQEIFYVPKNNSIFIYMTDITARKSIEEDLKKVNQTLEQRITEYESQIAFLNNKLKQTHQIFYTSKEQLNLSLLLSKAGTWSWDIPRDIITWDSYMNNLLGFQDRTLSGPFSDILKITHDEDHHKLISELKQAYKNNTDCDFEFRIIHADGLIRHLNMRGKVCLDGFSQPHRMAGICLDITARKEAMI